ncbi:MAG: hypothetical protein F6K24_52505 [Okeania sp. SIO2D1]|nr:hypothetical protein [Okeania sp. SIO2D1]
MSKVPDALPANIKAELNEDEKINKILQAAKKYGGTLSLAQAALATGFSRNELQKLLDDCQRFGYAEVTNDSVTGAIRYTFDL